MSGAFELFQSLVGIARKLLFWFQSLFYERELTIGVIEVKACAILVCKFK